MTSSIGTPPKPPRVAALGKPPTQSDSLDNLNRPEAAPQQKPKEKKDESLRQLNIRLPAWQHKEIRRAAFDQDMTMIEYLVKLHDEDKRRRGEG